MTSELTPTEMIATRLFGWKQLPAVEGLMSRYYRLHGEECCVWPDDSFAGSNDWPNFVGRRDQWYWVRKMEDALAERGLLSKYCDAIREVIWETSNDLVAKVDINLWPLRATVEQRLAAALKVLGEVGL